MMLSLGAAAIGLLSLFWLYKARRAALLASLLILFGLSYRIVDIAYLDLFGPVFATELDKFVGGNGATPYFVASVLCVVLPFAVLFRNRSIVAGIPFPLPSHGYVHAAQRVGFAATCVLLAALYIDMLRIGTIPLLSGMDRLQYQDIAGVLHNPVYNLGFLPAGALGILTVVPRLQGKSYGIPPIIAFLLLLLYWALTGNRFSAFLLAVCSYALPFAAVVALQATGLLAPRPRQDPWTVLVSANVIVPLVSILGAFAIVGLLINSYYDVRNYADPTFEIFQRVFVQPVEIYASQWEFVGLGRADGLNLPAMDEVLFNPVDATGNTTMRYLMIRELGYFRAMELINFGQQYAGGYPEILIELFGVYLAIPVLLVLGIGAAFMARLAIRNILQGCLLSAFLAIYVNFAFTLVYVGGGLNTLYSPTLGLKVLALYIITQVERSIVRRRRQPEFVARPQPPPVLASSRGSTWVS